MLLKNLSNKKTWQKRTYIPLMYSSKKIWKTLVEGQSKPVKTARTKERAMKNSVIEAKRRGVEHVIHNRDGKISDKDSYGNDPAPPIDKVH